MNKTLVAQFVASVNVSELPTSAFNLNELDDNEIGEILEQSLRCEHNSQIIYVIPGFKNGKYKLDCYIINDKKLMRADYTPSWEELSDILEAQKWNGDWVRKSRVEKIMKYIDWNNDI